MTARSSMPAMQHRREKSDTVDRTFQRDVAEGVPEEEDLWDSPAVGLGVRVAGIAALGALVALVVSIGSPVVTAILDSRPT